MVILVAPSIAARTARARDNRFIATLLLVTEDPVRAVGVLEEPYLIFRQLHTRRTDRLLELLDLRRADDRRGHPGFVEEPRESDLRRRPPAARRQFETPVGHGEIV